jgi:hypothetical protein
MKKLFTLATLSLCLMSCSDVCYENNCGTVIGVTINTNLPINGDEKYQIHYKTVCDEFRTVLIPFNLNDGEPGSPTQPVKKINIGDYYCN